MDHGCPIIPHALTWGSTLTMEDVEFLAGLVLVLLVIWMIGEVVIAYMFPEDRA